MSKLKRALGLEKGPVNESRRAFSLGFVGDSAGAAHTGPQITGFGRGLGAVHDPHGLTGRLQPALRETHDPAASLAVIDELERAISRLASAASNDGFDRGSGQVGQPQRSDDRFDAAWHAVDGLLTKLRGMLQP